MPRDLFEENGIDVLSASGGVDLLADDKPVEQAKREDGFLARTGENLSKAWQEATTPIVSKGELLDSVPGFPILEKAAAVAAPIGKTVVDAALTGARGLYHLTTSPETRENISDALGYMGDTDFVKAQLKTLRGAHDTAKAVAPRGTEFAENVLDASAIIPTLGALRVGAKTAKDVAVKGATGIADALYPKPTFEQAVGQVLQGKTKDIPKGKMTLSKIDLEGISTYQELLQRIEDAIPRFAKKVDDALNEDPIVHGLNDLKTVRYSESGTRVVNRYVEDALSHLREMYLKTGDNLSSANIDDLFQRAKHHGLTRKDVNDIARQYNVEFGDKAFSKTGDPLTSVNAQAFQNVRSGLKDVARRGMDDTAKDADEIMASLYNTRRLMERNVEAANRLKQKIDERGLGEKLGRHVLTALDIATLGTAKGMILKMFPRGLGYKVKNYIDLENSLKRNLKVINDEFKRVNKPKSTAAASAESNYIPPGIDDIGYIQDPYLKQPPIYDAVYEGIPELMPIERMQLPPSPKMIR